MKIETSVNGSNKATYIRSLIAVFHPDISIPNIQLPKPTDKRYCNNGIALNFIASKTASPSKKIGPPA